MVRSSLITLALLGAAPAAAEVPANPQIDYQGFERLTGDLAQVRAAHRLGWADFARQARAEGAVLLMRGRPMPSRAGIWRARSTCPSPISPTKRWRG